METIFSNDTLRVDPYKQMTLSRASYTYFRAFFFYREIEKANFRK